jgi:hypothetical protein
MTFIEVTHALFATYESFCELSTKLLALIFPLLLFTLCISSIPSTQSVSEFLRASSTGKTSTISDFILFFGRIILSRIDLSN